MTDFEATISSRILAIGHSPIPASHKSVLRLLFKEWQASANKMTQSYISGAIPDLGGHHTHEDIRTHDSSLRQVRQVIRDLRVLHGAPILSDSHGYWIPHSESEVRTYLTSLEREARAAAAAHFETYTAMKKSLGIDSAFFDRQGQMFDRPQQVVVPSASTERTYTVRALPAGGYSCECAAYKFRRVCRHIQQAASDIVSGVALSQTPKA